MILVLLFAVTLNAVLQIIVVEQHVALFAPSYIVFKVCNPSSIIIQASSLTISGVNALDPLPISIGRIAPLMCKEFTFHFIPTSTKPMRARLTYMYMGQKGPITGNAEYVIPLDLKIPTLQSIPISTELLENGEIQLTFKVINPSAFDFNGTIEVLTANNTRVLLLNAYIPAKSEKVFKLRFRALVTSLTLKYLMDGIVIGSDRLTFPKPRLSVTLSILNGTLSLPGKLVIRIESPIILKGTLSLQGNCLPLPQVKHIVVYQSKEVAFTIERCEDPAKLRAVFTTALGRWSTSKVIPIKKPTVAFSTLTLQSGAINRVRVVVIGSKELVRLEIPNSLVRPLVAKPNTTFTVIPLPIKSAKHVTAKVILGSTRYTFDLLLLPFQPTIDFSLNKRSLIEGTRENLTLCVKNSWTYDISNATLTFSVLGKSVSLSFDFPKGSTRCVSLNVTSPWYPAKVTASASLEVLGYTISRKFTLQVLQNPNLINLDISCPKKIKWNQKTLKIELKAHGEGKIKNLKITINGDFITQKTLKYEKVRNGFHETVDVPISISKKVNSVSVNVISNYEVCLYTCKDVSVKKSCKVRVLLPPSPTFKVHLKSYTLILSKINKVPVVIEARGKFKDLTVIVNAKNAIIVGSNSVDMGNFTGTKVINFELSPQSQKPVILTVTLRVRDLWNNVNTLKYSFNLVVRRPKEPKIVINILTPKLRVGMNKVRISISNVGNLRAYNVNINVVSPDVVIPKPNIFLKTVLPGQRLIRIIEVDVPESLAGQSAQISVSALYNNLTSTFNYKLPVRQGPQLSISDINVMPKTIVPGTQATLSLVLSNQGDDHAFSVRVKLVVPKGFKVIGPANVFLGTVRAQASLPVAFTIMPKEDMKPGTYVGNIVVTYNYAGASYKVEQPVTFIVAAKQVQTAEKSSIDWRYLAAGGVILLIIVIWGVRRVKSASSTTEGLEE